MSQGKIITIEGLDGCGKKTQSKELAKNLRINCYGCYLISFPRYHTPTGKVIKDHQDNKTLDKLSLEKITGLYAKDRFEAQKDILFWVNYHDTIVVNDRYIESNMAYQGARLFDIRKKVWEYIYGIEIKKLGNRPSDIVILLDMPAEYSARAMKDQERVLDVNECNLDYQKKVRTCYLELSKIYNWNVINCLREDKSRKTDQDISKEIYCCVQKQLPVTINETNKYL